MYRGRTAQTVVAVDPAYAIWLHKQNYFTLKPDVLARCIAAREAMKKVRRDRRTFLQLS